MRPVYKQRCMRCKKNMVVVTSRNKFPVCYDCEKSEMQGEITDPAMKTMFDIPEEYYMNNIFLRDIKKNYIKFKSLSEKQIEAFKKTVEDIKNKKNTEEK
jgi:hypothetical protein